MDPPATIYVVDDDASFRKALARVLETAGYEVALFESGDQLLRLPPGDTPGCILLDFKMSNLDGLALQERLAQTDCLLPIIFITAHADIPISVSAMKAGAEDFLTKPVSKDLVLSAIDRALARYHQRRHQRGRLDALRMLVSTLTERESEVFVRMVRGRMNKQIAYELGTSERTIKAHRHAIMEKLKVASVAEAVLIAERLGMLTSDS